MAIGDIVNFENSRSIELLAATIAANGQPTVVGDGLDVSVIQKMDAAGIPSVLTLLLFSTIGTAVLTVEGRLWGWHDAAGFWIPLGVGTDAGKGKINNGAVIGESVADGIRHAEPIDLPGHFERLYLEIVTIGGTNTSVSAKLIACGNS